MKFSLIAAVALLALAQGSFAQDAADLEKITQYFENLKNKMTEDVTAFLTNQDVANQAQTFMQERKTQLEPLATQIQEQLRAAATKFEEHITPLAANVQPVVENFQQQMEALVQKLMEKTRSISN
ncbi:type-4 ice-structuring protein [Paralichthys olivaceus]|uniref:Type-4 ice-structuring protein n=1 Tax=Paralichthys olivaceus TaxID=8255 RepID=AFP4_PAROL|nr:PREDICTED: type-4 ice-structuring protein [Paralichthys olivaceus]Q8JI37.1 RecName: Full=Type-4 ice-structuring protein; AltName: Full=Antifreeze protein type IV; Flags: Precursor [Paralichthys olivaceus]AAM46175.1 antifreeze protein type IV [Paralichthys olivaceus]